MGNSGKTFTAKRFSWKFIAGSLWSLWIIVALVVLLAPLGAHAQEKGKTSTYVWLDPDGNPLPFQTDEALKEFLREARVVRSRAIGRGVTRPRHVLLEKDGVRMNAHFSDFNKSKDIARMRGGRVEIGFRDSYLFNIAAYELSRLLGLDNVPPWIVRRVRGKSGSLGVWLEDTMTERSRQEGKIKPPDVLRWNRQLYTMWIFDELIYNTDRTQENYLIDKNWKVWMIDHTRAFRRNKELKKPGRIRYCERNLWEKLQALEEKAVREKLRKYLTGSEIKTMFKRRNLLVAHIQQLIDKFGEDYVLYTLE